MGNHPRIEDKDVASFITTRTRNSELWFINNPKLEQEILAYAAKYSTSRNVKLYALALEGTHKHEAAEFPDENRADFMRDFNSAVAKAVPRFCPDYLGGSLFERRYSQEILPAADDIEARFFYTVLQPVNDGLVSKISDYPGYNCFHDAIYGIERTFTMTKWKEFNAARKRKPSTPIYKYQFQVTLKYDRIPGYESLSTKEYADMMMKKLEIHRLEVIRNREARGLFGFVGREALVKIKPGTRAINPKKSTRDSHRPRVLSVCPERYAYFLTWYFDIIDAYRVASEKYRNGDLSAIFPKGTYKPYCKFAQPPPTV